MTEIDFPFVEGCRDPVREAGRHPRANATFVILARDKELDGVLDSMRSLETRFNQWFNYPYVFLNNEPFGEEFRAGVQAATKAKCEFGVVGEDMWGYPDWVDLEDVKERIAEQGDRGIMYGGMESYHHMCRFFSGFFFNHPLLLKYEWYWRVEPDVTFFCDITYDPFFYMQQHGKSYGFVIAIRELRETVPNMFRYASYYRRKANITSQGMWEMFLEDQPWPEHRRHGRVARDGDRAGADSGADFDRDLPLPIDVLQSQPAKDLPPIKPNAIHNETYNMCHFWSNFEIGRFDWLRTPEYRDFFNTMDRSGGFWYERWGDAPIHSLAAGIFLSPQQVHYFRDFGYQHTDIQHCGSDFGCRCECPSDLPEVETKDGSCIDDWVRIMGGYLDD